MNQLVGAFLSCTYFANDICCQRFAHILSQRILNLFSNILCANFQHLSMYQTDAVLGHNRPANKEFSIISVNLAILDAMDNVEGRG